MNFVLKRLSYQLFITFTTDSSSEVSLLNNWRMCVWLILYNKYISIKNIYFWTYNDIKQKNQRVFSVFARIHKYFVAPNTCPAISQWNNIKKRMKINIKFRYGFGSTETAFNFRIKFHCTLTAMKRQINLVLVFVFCKEIQEKKKKKTPQIQWNET